MTTHILSMTYGPKIKGVMDGSIRQTIRRTERVKVGDKLILYTWTGKPYRSPWGERRTEIVRRIIEIECFAHSFIDDDNWVNPWGGWHAAQLASLDGIEPPTGLALKEVLEKFHGKFTDEPVRFQVIRW